LAVAQARAACAHRRARVCGTLFDKHPAVPYWICRRAFLVAGLIAWQFLHKPSQAVADAKVQSAS